MLASGQFRFLFGAIVLSGFLFGALTAQALDFSDRYRSPRNPERKVRASTELIVLHTTEAPARSSLNKVSERGECHFVVTEEGSVYRIIDRDREAFHAGRSMWKGKEDVDKFSIGIECVGYHDKPMSAIQLQAIRNLVKELQLMYRLSDDKVVTHGHVAYGAPNKWHRQRHRGRKRCGMLFAMPSVRARLGLESRPARDEDTRARRLVIGDDYLQNVLYGKVDTMRGRLAGPAATAGSSGGILGWLGLSGGKTTYRRQTETASPSTSKPKSRTVVKNQSSPPSKKTSAPPRSIAELKARGYVLKGSVSPTHSAAKIAGSKWNDPDTFYTIRNKVIAGSDINPAKIEKGMSIWMRQ